MLAVALCYVCCYGSALASRDKRVRSSCGSLHFLPTSWLSTSPTVRPANIAREIDSWRCELHQQDRWETRSLVKPINRLPWKEKPPYFGVVDNNRSRFFLTFSYTIQDVILEGWHHKHLCSTESRICQIMGQLRLRRTMGFCGCLPKACENSVVSEFFENFCKCIFKTFYF